MNITSKTINRASEQIGGILRMYRTEIDKAFLKADDALTVSLGNGWFGMPKQYPVGCRLIGYEPYIKKHIGDNTEIYTPARWHHA